MKRSTKKLIFFGIAIFVFLYWSNIGNLSYFAHRIYCGDQSAIVVGKDYGTDFHRVYRTKAVWQNPIASLWIREKFFCSTQDAEEAGYRWATPWTVEPTVE
ncbi:MAG: hypothetical protein RLY47_51 [Candidatus Parcubacteria bacterium]|jgi:hypothetical protein